MRANQAPRHVTVLVALVLMVLGALGTWGSLLPDRTGGWLFVAATVVMLLGVLLPGL